MAGTPRSKALPPVAVVVVNWNGWRMTLECISALRKSRGVEWRIYIVDNASTDESASHLKNCGPEVVFVQSPNNSGWSGGNNQGVQRALGDGHNYIFLLNNDALVRSDTLKILLQEHIKLADASILGPIHCNLDEEHLNFVGARMNPATGMPDNLDSACVDVGHLPEIYDTAYIKGAAILASRKQFERIGLFDDRYYLNYDETDWCFRAKAAGYTLKIVRSARIIHEGSATMGGWNSPLNLYFMTRNGLLFSETYASVNQRLAFTKLLLRDFSQTFIGGSWIRRYLRLLLSRHTLLVAFRRAIRDYALRRFGDCPTLIRQLPRT